MTTTMNKHHNPTIAQPHLDELVETLGSDWSDYSWSNNLCASVGYEYGSNKVIIIFIPNSLQNDLMKCHVNQFHIQLDNPYTGKSKIIATLDTISETITYVTKFLEKKRESGYPQKARGF